MQDITRRKFLIGGAMLAAGTFSGCFRGNPIYREAKEQLNILSDGKIRFTRQLVGKSADTRKVLFEGAEELRDAKIELKGENGEIATIDAKYTPFTDDNTLRHQYEAELTGLTAGKSYEYRIITADGASEWIKFSVPAEGKLTTLIFPDSQSADYSVWEKVAQAAYANNKDADFFVNMGDLVDNGEDHTQWEAWFRALTGIEEHIPCAPILGNHECYDNKWEVRLPNAYLNYFPLPTNGSKEFSNYYYCYDLGPCRFISLTTEWDEVNGFKEGLLDEELEWFKNVAVKTDKPWKIAMMHRDALQYRIKSRPERKEGISEAGEIFMPLFEKYNINIVFTAHLHTYRNRGMIKNGRHSENAPYYILTGVAGDVRYPNLWTDHALDKVVAPQPETDNYLVMRITGDTANIKCYRDDGVMIDEAEIKRRHL